MSDARIDRVEERIAWLERHVVEQDRAMLELRELVEQLQAELRRVREREGSREAGSEPPPSPFDERPPHY